MDELERLRELLIATRKYEVETCILSDLENDIEAEGISAKFGEHYFVFCLFMNDDSNIIHYLISITKEGVYRGYDEKLHYQNGLDAMVFSAVGIGNLSMIFGHPEEWVQKYNAIHLS